MLVEEERLVLDADSRSLTIPTPDGSIN